MSDLNTDLETLENALRSFFQSMKRPQTWAQVSAQAGVTLDRPAAVILQTIMRSPTGRSRVHDLATQLGIEAPSVTRKTQELEQAGYLRRTPDANDKRAISLEVTPEGFRVSNLIWKAQREVLAQALQNWTEQERGAFVQQFERFSGGLIQASEINRESTKQDK